MALTRIADLEAELNQLQLLNAKLEEDLLVAEGAGGHMSKAGNGHDLDDISQPGLASSLGKLAETR